ncbi:uncharacterized protein LOC110976090 [Acanthaster planci]|uniref:Uncharacterized protein LOC110976090 n=1 Tax=Acanthaster planci TaxID=133434 RepID=A0A8B7XYB7_ACAPL|nr:uncharacterized protein LOC110976090 [Acanthaster planci]
MAGHDGKQVSGGGRCDNALWRLAGELGQSWKPVGRHLGYSEAGIENLVQDYSANAHERAYQMLLGWKNTTDPSVRNEQLRGAVKDAERLDLLPSVMNVTGCGPSPGGVSGSAELNKQYFVKKLKNFVRSKMSKLPLVPWITTGCVHVDQVFTQVQLLISIMSAYFPIRVPLKSHNAIFTDLTGEGDTRIDFCGTRILMRGRTGSGKTTLLTKYAYDWSTDKPEALLRNVDVVLVLPMRKVDQHSNLGQAVLDHMLPNERRITPAAIEQYCEDHPEEVVILLDGYDEFKGKGLDQEDCGNIVKMLRGEWLTECRVVVTTRPGRVGDFKDDYESYRHLEITGFTTKDIDDYVHKVFEGENKLLGNKLLAYLEENHLKEDLASIPLMLTAFCQLTKWTDGQDFKDLNTISKLFDRLIECMFKHANMKISTDCSVSRATAVGLADPDQLVLELGKVALEGFLGGISEELIFSEEDFTRCSDNVQVIEQGLRVGFLSRDVDSRIRPQKFEELQLEGQKPSPRRDISFILKSIQEKCAGKYLAHLLETGDEDSFTNYLQKVDNDQRVLDYTNILVFASASNIEAARRIVSHVILMLRSTQNENISQYLTAKLHFKHCQKTQRLIETCLQLNFESNSKGQFNHLFDSLFGDNCCVRLVGISTYVAKALGYLFRHGYQRLTPQEASGDYGPPEVKQALSVKSLQLICIKLEISNQFREFLNCYPGTEEEISNFMRDSLKSEGQTNISKILHQLETSEQKIPSYFGHRSDLTFSAVFPIWQELNKHQVQDFSLSFVLSGLKESSLDELVLNGVTAECPDWSVLFKMIHDGLFAQMTKLTLSLNGLTFQQTAELAAVLVATPNLKELKISGNELGEGFVENLPELPELTSVVLDNLNLSSGAMIEFTKKMKQYPHLQKLDLRWNENIDDDVIHSICGSLLCQQTWKELRLSLYRVSEAGLDNFQRSIGLAKELTHLNLVHSPIPDKVIQYCAPALSGLKQLVDLRISGIPSSTSQEGSPCTEQTVEAFTSEMHKLQHLKFLSILYTKMEPEAFICMLNSCRKHPSLKTFRFSRVCLPLGSDVGAACKEAETTFLRLWV